MTSVSDERIEPALHALLAGDALGLQAALADDSELVDADWNGNTLLEWATQPPHGVDRACIDVLIDAGAVSGPCARARRLLEPRRTLCPTPRCRRGSDVARE